MNANPPIGILILAAGSSSRMGQPKQLLPWGSDTLLTHAIKIAQEVDSHSIVVVLGSQAEQVKPLLKPFSVQQVLNENWSSGMGSSIAKGFDFINQNRDTPAAVIVLVCDQPFITGGHLQSMIAKHREDDQAIVATQYANSYGVPVLFPRELYPDLIGLPHEAGARKMIENHIKRTSFVLFEEGKIDLDTPDEYAKFVNKKN